MEENNTSFEPQKIDRHLQLALSYVTDAWCPINQFNQKKIRELVNSDNHSYIKENLITELKSDPSLMLHVIRECRRFRKDPIKVIGEPDLNLLKIILSGEATSTHQLSAASEHQKSRMFEEAIGLEVASKLSYETDSDPLLTISTAAIRQFGLTLISWNYPHVYARAVKSASPSKKLEDILESVLGFAPESLAIQLGVSLSMPPTVMLALGVSVRGEIDPEIKNISDQISKICKIGESFARMENPSLKESESSRWELLKQEATDLLGYDGLYTLKNHIKSYISKLVTANPEIYTEVAASLPKKQINNYGKQLRDNNSYIKHCTPIVKECISSVYELIIQDSISKEALDKIVHEIIPVAGFLSGAVYLLDPHKLLLVPKFVMGTEKLSQLTPIKYQLNTSDEPLILGFKGNAPLHYSNKNEKCICGVLGVAPRAGVLTLKLGGRLSNQPSEYSERLFKAVRQVVADTLLLT